MKDDPDHFLVIGCSTGGLEAMRYLLPNLELGNSTAVVVPHRDYEGIFWHNAVNLPGTVKSGRTGETIEAGTHYVVPGEGFSETSIEQKRFLTTEREQYKEDTIDIFLQSAAEAYGHKTISVILSGAGRDGSTGSQAIKKVGGRVLVQRESFLNKIDFTKTLRNSTADRYETWSYTSSMPAITETEVEVDFAGPLPSLVDRVNRMLREEPAIRKQDEELPEHRQGSYRQSRTA